MVRVFGGTGDGTGDDGTYLAAVAPGCPPAMDDIVRMRDRTLFCAPAASRDMPSRTGWTFFCLRVSSLSFSMCMAMARAFALTAPPPPPPPVGWAEGAAAPLAWKLVTPSDCKHQSAPDRHGY